MEVKARAKTLEGGCHDFTVDDSRYPILVAGFGAGKTWHFCLKALGEAEQNRGVCGYRTPILLMEPTYRMADDVLLPTFREILDFYGLRHTWNHSNRRLVLTDWGTHFLVDSAENYERRRGLSLPALGVDEVDTIKPRKAQRMWEVMIGRLRVPGSTGRGFCATTPEGFGFAWKNWAKVNVEGTEREESYVLHRASTRDNWHLPDTYVERLRESYDSNLLAAYMEGIFVNLHQGSIYEMFDAEKNIDARVRYWPEKPLELSWDFNVNPMTVLASQTHKPRGRPAELHVFDEVVVKTTTTARTCEAVIDRFGDHEGVVFLYGDASGGRLQTSGAGRSDLEIIDQILGKAFKNYEARWMKRNPRRRDRYASVNAMCHDAKGRRRFFMHPRCRYLREDLLSQTYKEGTTDADDQQGTIGHRSDALGYRIYYNWPLRDRMETRYGDATAWGRKEAAYHADNRRY